MKNAENTNSGAAVDFLMGLGLGLNCPGLPLPVSTNHRGKAVSRSSGIPQKESTPWLWKVVAPSWAMTRQVSPGCDLQLMDGLGTASMFRSNDVSPSLARPSSTPGRINTGLAPARLQEGDHPPRGGLPAQRLHPCPQLTFLNLISTPRGCHQQPASPA